jgi:hypothetical protein
MAINAPTPTEEGLKARIDNYYQGSTIAILIDDSAGDLTPTSDINAVVGKELTDTSTGYTRIQANLPNASAGGSPLQATAQSQDLIWTATGNMPLFTHVAYIIGGNLTVGDTTGVIDRIEPVNNNNPVDLLNGEKYKTSFLHKEELNYTT